MSETLARVEQVLRETFEDDELAVTRETKASDVEAWDSLMHVTLLVSVEKAFSIRFTSSEVARLENVGQLVDLVDAHRAKAKR